MTREVAIEKLELMRQKVDEETYRALVLAIKALSQEPTDRIEYGTDGNAYKLWISNGKEFEQKPCDNAISRILQRMWNCRGKHTTSIDKVAMEQIIRDELPSVTQKSGKWILNKEKSHFFDVYECSNCGKISGLTNYCPNCGAKMESEEQTE